MSNETYEICTSERIVNVLRDDLAQYYNEVSHFAKILSDTFLNCIV